MTVIVETINPLSLYSQVKAGLRHPDDDGSTSPGPPTEAPPGRRKKVQMRLVYTWLGPPMKKMPPYACIPECIVQHRLRSRLLKVPPLRPNARWIWARPGFQTSLNRKRARVEER